MTKVLSSIPVVRATSWFLVDNLEKWQKVVFSNELSVEHHPNNHREICRVDGNINSLRYQDICAAHYITNHRRGQILQQDSAPSHTSATILKFEKAKKVKMLQEWPAHSPNMNIIEHV